MNNILLIFTFLLMNVISTNPTAASSESGSEDSNKIVISSFFGKGFGNVFNQKIDLFKGPDDTTQDPANSKKVWWAKVAGSKDNQAKLRVEFATAAKEKEFEEVRNLDNIEITGFETVVAIGYPPYGMELPPARGWVCRPTLIIYDEAKK